MKQLFTYTIEIWYRANDEKDFFERTFIAESDEKAIELAKSIRRNIFKAEIKNKEPYHDPKMR